MPEEFERLFREHYELLYSAAYGLTGNRHDADSVLLSVFNKLLRTGLSPEQQRNPARCLHRAVMMSSFGVIRRQTAGRRERDELHVSLMAAIARLKPRAFEILLLHYKRDYSYAQIAELVGASEGTIAVTLTRLRASLREALQSAGCDQEGTSRESLRGLLRHHVESPSYLEMMVSRDWILERLRSPPPHTQQPPTEAVRR